MVTGEPEKVEQEEVVLAGEEPGSPPDDLAVEGPNFCGPQADDTINTRLVVAFGEQHRVAEDPGLVP